MILTLHVAVVYASFPWQCLFLIYDIKKLEI